MLKLQSFLFWYFFFCIICSLKKNENGEIEIDDFLAFIDRKQFRGAFLQPMNLYVSKICLLLHSLQRICVNNIYFHSLQQDVCPKQPFYERIRLVDWDAFIEKLGLEANLVQETD